MCPGPVETEPFESFLLLGIFVIVLALFFFLLGRLLFLRSCFYRWLLRNYFLDFLHFFGSLRFLNWLWRGRYFSGHFYKLGFWRFLHSWTYFDGLWLVFVDWLWRWQRWCKAWNHHGSFEFLGHLPWTTMGWLHPHGWRLFLVVLLKRGYVILQNLRTCQATTGRILLVIIDSSWRIIHLRVEYEVVSCTAQLTWPYARKWSLCIPSKIRRSLWQQLFTIAGFL